MRRPQHDPLFQKRTHCGYPAKKPRSRTFTAPPRVVGIRKEMGFESLTVHARVVLRRQHKRVQLAFYTIIRPRSHEIIGEMDVKFSDKGAQGVFP